MFGLDEDRVTSGFGLTRETGSGSVAAETGFGSEPTRLRFRNRGELRKLETGESRRLRR